MNKQLNSRTVKDILYPVFEKHGVNKAILFGSVAKGTSEKNSDIDILVDSGLKGLRFIGLLEDIRTALVTDVDLIDVSHISEGSAFESEIARTGVVIYEKH